MAVLFVIPNREKPKNECFDHWKPHQGYDCMCETARNKYGIFGLWAFTCLRKIIRGISRKKSPSYRHQREQFMTDLSATV